MPDRPKPFPDEADTKPDRFAAPCPACADADGKPTGEVVIEEWDGNSHRQSRRPCDLCWGSRLVNREALARWARLGNREEPDDDKGPGKR